MVSMTSFVLDDGCFRCVCDKGFGGEFCEIEEPVSFAVRGRGGESGVLSMALLVVLSVSLVLSGAATSPGLH
jgi:hypothetical protein